VKLPWVCVLVAEEKSAGGGWCPLGRVADAMLARVGLRYRRFE
jgi:hypothetical protein